ncbi:Imm8 family immunity protein [Paenibacillus sp. ACRRY]|uniref:Imm8 family immunity protein n=1 Tax=Paenibacillus sp. ACRRY TaxID=2918208 RepID=UPI001EF70ABF|nr:Imm8 family immunity protein [Paenibacillus sp. ACRRY]
MSEEWVDLEEFYVCIDAFIGEVGSKGSEVFRFYIVSPKWLLKALENSDEIELGRGYLITSDYSISKVEYRIKTIIGNCQKTSWDDVIHAISRYAIWESEQ